ncbi:hypothetical protein HMI55_005867, partial [Coelomomyces lativittatus]
PYDFIESGEWLFNIKSAPEWFQELIPKYSKNSSRTNGKQFKSNVQNIQKKETPIPGPYDFIESGEWLFNIHSAAPMWFQNFVSPPSILRRISGFSFHTFTQKTLDQVVYLKHVPLTTYSSIQYKLPSPSIKPESIQNNKKSLPLRKMNKIHSHQPIPKALPLKKTNNKVYPIQKKNFNHRTSPIQLTQKKSLSDDLDFTTGAWLFDPNRVPEWMKNQLPQPIQRLPHRGSMERLLNAFKRPFWVIFFI